MIEELRKDWNEMLSHGIKLEPEGGSRLPFGHPPRATYEFHFGMIKLLWWVLSTVAMPLFPSNRPPPTWPDRRFGRLFLSIVQRYQHTLHMVDYAAQNLGEAIAILEHDWPLMRNGAWLPITALRPWQSAAHVAPFYAEALLHYLTVQADCLAAALTQFFPKSTRRLKSSSFHDHRSSVLGIHQDMDPGYTDILRTSTSWFDLLVGGGEVEHHGLRDVVTHRFGTYQTGGISHSDSPDDVQYRLGMVSTEGWITEDLGTDLQRIVAGYFRMLDRLYLHFAERINLEVDGAEFDIDDSLFLVSEASAHRVWLYPSISLHTEVPPS